MYIGHASPIYIKIQFRMHFAFGTAIKRTLIQLQKRSFFYRPIYFFLPVTKAFSVIRKKLNPPCLSPQPPAQRPSEIIHSGAVNLEEISLLQSSVPQHNRLQDA